MIPLLPSKGHPRSAAQLRRWLFWLPVGSIFALWAILYLPHLRSTPGWYIDETLTYLASRSLFHGEPALQAYRMTYWNSMPYWPGYLWPTGLFGWLAGDDLVGARFFNTLLALAIASAIYLLGRSRFGCLPAWFGALLFLSYDQSVIQFRWVYPHNAVALGLTIMTLYLLRPSRPSNDWRAGLGLAIGSLAHPLFSYGALAAVLCRLKRPLAWPRLAAWPTVVILLTMAAPILYYWPRPWFFEDFAELVSFYRTSSSLITLDLLPYNFALFFRQDLFQAGGVIALLLCLRRRFYGLVILTGVVSLLLLKNRANLVQFYYQAIILTPLLAMAWAAGLSTLAHMLRRFRTRAKVARLAMLTAFALPAFFAISVAGPVWRGALVSRNQTFVTQSLGEVEAAADWLNTRTTPDDLVIANANLAWLLHAKTADLLQATLWKGAPTVYFSQGLPRERFRYPVELSGAKYIAFGDIDMRWTLNQLNVSLVMEALSHDNWKKVWSAEYYAIYANPRFQERNPAPK